jgi:hypothetical protein
MRCSRGLLARVGMITRGEYHIILFQVQYDFYRKDKYHWQRVFTFLTQSHVTRRVSFTCCVTTTSKFFRHPPLVSIQQFRSVCTIQQRHYFSQSHYNLVISLRAFESLTNNLNPHANTLDSLVVLEPEVNYTRGYTFSGMGSTIKMRSEK